MVLELNKPEVLECELCQHGNMSDPLSPSKMKQDKSFFFLSFTLTFGD